VHDLLGQPAPLAQLGGALADLLVQGHEGRVVLVQRLHLLHRLRDRREVVVHGGVLQGRGALLPLKQ
jgi:hypothetical protein